MKRRLMQTFPLWFLIIIPCGTLCAGEPVIITGLNGWAEWQLSRFQPISDEELKSERTFYDELAKLCAEQHSADAMKLIDKELKAHPERRELHLARALSIAMFRDGESGAALPLSFVMSGGERKPDSAVVPPWTMCKAILQEVDRVQFDVTALNRAHEWTLPHHLLPIQKVWGLTGVWWSSGISEMAAARARLDKHWSAMFDLQASRSPEKRVLRLQFLALCGRQDLLVDADATTAVPGGRSIREKWKTHITALLGILRAEHDRSTLRKRCTEWAQALAGDIPRIEATFVQLPDEIWALDNLKYENWRSERVADTEWQKGIDPFQPKSAKDQDSVNANKEVTNEILSVVLRLRDFRADVLRRFMSGDQGAVFSRDIVVGKGLRYTGGPAADLLFHQIDDKQENDFGWSSSVHCGGDWWLKAK